MSSHSNPDLFVYVVNFQDDNRKNRMIDRFQKVDMNITFVDPVYTSDIRICNQNITEHEKKTWSVFFQHIDSMKHFVNVAKSDDDLCIICEDDIYISKLLKEEIKEIMELYKNADLDVMLLSYLWPFPIKNMGNYYFPELSESSENFNLCGYPDDLWGAHMYMLSSKHAKILIDRFTPEFASETSIPFCSDWHITKFGKRALLIPMVGVEEGGVKTDNEGQIAFHIQCFEYNYNEQLFF